MRACFVAVLLVGAMVGVGYLAGSARAQCVGGVCFRPSGQVFSPSFSSTSFSSAPLFSVPAFEHRIRVRETIRPVRFRIRQRATIQSIPMGFFTSSPSGYESIQFQSAPLMPVVEQAPVTYAPQATYATPQATVPAPPVPRKAPPLPQKSPPEPRPSAQIGPRLP